MDEEDLPPVSRSAIELKVKWYLKQNNIFIIGILLGIICNLCVSAIINLTINPDLREIFLIWQCIPVKVWISIIFFALYIIFVYYFKLVKSGKQNA